MALCQLEEGSPLRTLCLLISGKPADVFCSSDNASSLPGAKQISQQPTQVIYHSNTGAECDCGFTLISVSYCHIVICFISVLYII